MGRQTGISPPGSAGAGAGAVRSGTGIMSPVGGFVRLSRGFGTCPVPLRPGSQRTSDQLPILGSDAIKVHFLSASAMSAPNKLRTLPCRPRLHIKLLRGVGSSQDFGP